MPLTNLDEKQGCRFALWMLGGGVVVLLLLPVLPIHSHISTRALRTKTQMKDLELAVKTYRTEYNRFPSSQSPPPTADNTAGYDTTNSEGKKIIEILMGTDTEKNPRSIGFYDPPPAKKGGGGYTQECGLLDIWNTRGYIIHLDYDGDGTMADPEHPGATIVAKVIVYSAGRDRDFNTWKDNLKSWEP